MKIILFLIELIRLIFLAQQLKINDNYKYFSYLPRNYWSCILQNNKII